MNDLFLRVFKHLLPNGKAWRITAEKPLRSFFEGLTGVAADARTFTDRVWLDIRPHDTRELQQWADQFALNNPTREQLAGAWQALGGQSPAYFQAALRAAGFNVYIHEWWEPGSAPAVGQHLRVTPRNPLLVLRASSDERALTVECGEPEAQCGEAWAQCGNSRNPAGYPLVNKAPKSEPGPVSLIDYSVPADANYWPYFLYIGGPTFGTIAKVPQARKVEFEALALKLAPAHLWIGVLVEYV